MFLVPTSSPGFERQPLPTIGDETTNISLLQRHPAAPTGTGSARSTTAGPSCTARWTPSTTSADTASKLEDVGPGAGHRAPPGAVGRGRRALGPGRPGRGRADDRRQGVPGRDRAPAGRDGGAAPAPRRRWAGSRAPTWPGWASSSSSTWSARPRPCPTAPTGAIGDGVIEFAHRQAQHTATPGGTVEVFRTIIAQHDLGLPRPDYPGRKVFLTARPPRHGGGITSNSPAGAGPKCNRPRFPRTRVRPNVYSDIELPPGPLRRSALRSIVPSKRMLRRH